MRSLNTNVLVDGTWYRPGEVPPADVAERITNPKVWDDDDGMGVVDPGQARVDLGYSEQTSEAPVPLERPLGNASKKTWAAYAAQEGVDIEDDMNRDDIIAAVDLSKE